MRVRSSVSSAQKEGRNRDYPHGKSQSDARHDPRADPERIVTRQVCGIRDRRRFIPDPCEGAQDSHGPATLAWQHLFHVRWFR